MTWRSVLCRLFVGHDWLQTHQRNRIFEKCFHCQTERPGWTVDQKRTTRLKKRLKTREQVRSTVQDIKRRA